MEYTSCGTVEPFSDTLTMLRRATSVPLVMQEITSRALGTQTHFAFLVAHHNEGTKTKSTASFHHFAGAVDVDHLLRDAIVFLLLPRTALIAATWATTTTIATTATTIATALLTLLTRGLLG